MTRRLVVLAFVWIFVGAASVESDDSPTKRRELLTSHLIREVNILLRQAHYLQFELPPDTLSQVAADSTHIRLLGSAAGDLMQWIEVVGRCADCDSYSQPDCDTLTGLRSAFAYRMDSVMSNSDRDTVLPVSSDSLTALTDSILAELDRFLIFECTP